MSLPTFDDVKTLFEQLDSNNSGVISVDAFERILRENALITLDSRSVKMLAALSCKGEPGTMTVDELKNLYSYIEKGYAAFRTYDTDNSGQIDCNGLKNALTDLKFDLSLPVVSNQLPTTGTLNFADFIKISANIYVKLSVLKQVAHC